MPPNENSGEVISFFDKVLKRNVYFDPSDPPFLFLGVNATDNDIRSAVRTKAYVRVTRGVWAKTTLHDPDGLYHVFASRIMTSRFGNKGCLSMSSAAVGGAVDGKIFVGTHEIRAGEQFGPLVVRRVKSGVRVGTTHIERTIPDPLGTVAVMSETEAMTFIQCARGASTVEGAQLPTPALLALAQSLLAQHGGDESLALDFISSVCRDAAQLNALDEARLQQTVSRQFNHLIDAWRSSPQYSSQRSIYNAGVYWFKTHVGDLSTNGNSWTMTYVNSKLRMSCSDDYAGSFAEMFVGNLQAEGANKRVEQGYRQSFKDGVQHDIETGCRYMSNLVVTDDPTLVPKLPIDRLRGRLRNFAAHGIFSGRFVDIDIASEDIDALIYKSQFSGPTLRLSGVQAKTGTCLTEQGRLTDSSAAEFTHLLKFGGKKLDKLETMSMNEWFCMNAMRRADMNVSTTALLLGMEGRGPSVLVERWDIPSGADDRRLIFAEDMNSVLGRPSTKKYDSSMEEVAAAVAEHSTSPVDDLIALYKMTVAAYAIGNNDLHTKNFSLLKVADPTVSKFESVRLAPVYDMLSVNSLPSFRGGPFCLPLSGKKTHLTLDDLALFAINSCGVAPSGAEPLTRAFLLQLAGGFGRTFAALPEPIKRNPTWHGALHEIMYTVATRCSSLLTVPLADVTREMGPGMDEVVARGKCLYDLGLMSDRALRIAEHQRSSDVPAPRANTAVTPASRAARFAPLSMGDNPLIEPHNTDFTELLDSVTLVPPPSGAELTVDTPRAIQERSAAGIALNRKLRGK